MSFDYERAYRMMYLVRCTEEAIVTHYHQEELMRCPTHLSIGQEGAAVGAMMALKRDHNGLCFLPNFPEILGFLAYCSRLL